MPSWRYLAFFIFLFSLSVAPVQALRIVSLLPSHTEIVEALGAGNQLVGVTRYDAFPEGSVRANVGDFLTPQWEILLSQHPDIVLAGDWPSAPTVARLRSLKIRVVELDSPATLAALEASIRTLGQAIELPPSRAEGVIAGMRVRLAALRQKHAAQPPMKLYLEIDPPNWTIGAKDYLNDALALLQLTNIFGAVPRKALQASSESVIEMNPDVILAFHGTAEAIRQRPGWSSIRAVQRGRIITDISADDLVRPSPRLVAGLERLSARLLEKQKP